VCHHRCRILFPPRSPPRHATGAHPVNATVLGVSAVARRRIVRAHVAVEQNKIDRSFEAEHALLKGV
jgi:hypothetical protein